MADNKNDDIAAVQTEYVDQVLKPEEQENLGFDPKLEVGGSHHKAHAERRLVLKSDLLILPLLSLVFLIAYMVCRIFFFQLVCH